MNKNYFIYIINLVVLILLTLSWYFFVYSYFDNQVKLYSSSLTSLRRAKNKLLKSRFQEDQLSKEIKSLKSKYNKLAITQKFNNYSEPLTWIINLIELSNLSLKKYNPQKIISKPDYNLLKANFLISGSYFNFLSFFKSLNKYPAAVLFQKLSLKSLKNTKESGGELLCSCDLNIKFLDY